MEESFFVVWATGEMTNSSAAKKSRMGILVDMFFCDKIDGLL